MTVKAHAAPGNEIGRSGQFFGRRARFRVPGPPCRGHHRVTRRRPTPAQATQPRRRHKARSACTRRPMMNPGIPLPAAVDRTWLRAARRPDITRSSALEGRHAPTRPTFSGLSDIPPADRARLAHRQVSASASSGPMMCRGGAERTIPLQDPCRLPVLPSTLLRAGAEPSQSVDVMSLSCPSPTSTLTSSAGTDTSGRQRRVRRCCHHRPRPSSR